MIISSKGIDEFDGLALASGNTLDFTLDLMSVIKKDRPLEIKSINLVQPNIHVKVLKNGKANYDIAVPTDARIEETAQETDYSGFQLLLNEYSITEAKVVYDDKPSDVYLEINDLNHIGSGNFTIDVFDLDTQTEIKSISVKQGGVSYLTNASATLDAIFNIDNKNSKYTLKDNDLRINALQLITNGFVQMAGDDINMELEVNTPQNEFKHLLSMIPHAYIQGYEDVKADGKFNLNANINGTYNGVTGQMPAFRVKMALIMPPLNTLISH